MGEPQIIAEAIAAIGLHDIALSGRDTWTTSTRACEWNQRPRPRRGGLGGASGGHRTASFLCDGAVMLGRATTTRPHLRHAARPFGSGCTARPVPLHRAGLAGMADLLCPEALAHSAYVPALGVAVAPSPVAADATGRQEE